jgi:hypothetical protein
MNCSILTVHIALKFEDLDAVLQHVRFPDCKAFADFVRRCLPKAVKPRHYKAHENFRECIFFVLIAALIAQQTCRHPEGQHETFHLWMFVKLTVLDKGFRESTWSSSSADVYSATHGLLFKAIQAVVGGREMEGYHIYGDPSAYNDFAGT